MRSVIFAHRAILARHYLTDSAKFLIIGAFMFHFASAKYGDPHVWGVGGRDVDELELENIP